MFIIVWGCVQACVVQFEVMSLYGHVTPRDVLIWSCYDHVMPLYGHVIIIIHTACVIIIVCRDTAVQNNTILPLNVNENHWVLLLI